MAFIQLQLINQLPNAAVGLVGDVALWGGRISNALHDILLMLPLVLQGLHLSSVHSWPSKVMDCSCIP